VVAIGRRGPAHLERDAVEDQVAEADRVRDEVRAAVAQQRRDSEPHRLDRDEAHEARRADRDHNAVDEVRRLAMQPGDGAERRQARPHLFDDLRIDRVEHRRATDAASSATLGAPL
jgi:hypothetical protein